MKRYFQKSNGGTCGTCKRDKRFCKECRRGFRKRIKRENRLTWERKANDRLTVDSTVVSTVASTVGPTVILSLMSFQCVL